jgi:hypothetical protein
MNVNYDDLYTIEVDFRETIKSNYPSTIVATLLTFFGLLASKDF